MDEPEPARFGELRSSWHIVASPPVDGAAPTILAPLSPTTERLSQSCDVLTLDGPVEDARSVHEYDSLDSTHVGSSPNSIEPCVIRSHQMMPGTADYYRERVDGSVSAVNCLDGRPREEEEEEEVDQGEKIKSKLLTAWNNMKHGWTVRTRTSFKYDSAILLLGKCYSNSKSEKDTHRRQTVNGGPLSTTSFDRFISDFSTRIWCTYRKDFPKLSGTGITSDVGWGCMLRSGQMLLAQALTVHLLGRDWVLHHTHARRNELILHRQILRLFGDHSMQESPFSIQRLVSIGIGHGKRPGDWYGPASVAYVLRDALDQAPADNPLLNQLSIYVAPDCTVYKEDILQLCTRPKQVSSKDNQVIVKGDGTSATSSARSSNHSLSSLPDSRSDNTASQAAYCAPNSTGHCRTPSCVTSSHWRPVVLLIPVRLGGESINPIYMQCVQSMLAHELCLGIIGGRPKHSLYFVGWQDDKLIHLDPHFCQDTVDMRFRDFNIESYHCVSPRKMSMSKMDPSCTIGFYCHSAESLTSLEADMRKLAMPAKEHGIYPLLVFQDGHFSDVGHSRSSSPQRYLRVHHLDKKGRVKPSTLEGKDDFVFL